MNVAASASVSVIVSVSVNLKPDRERKHERQTQKATDSMVCNVNPKNHTRTQTFLETKTKINSEELTNLWFWYKINDTKRQKDNNIIKCRLYLNCLPNLAFYLTKAEVQILNTKTTFQQVLVKSILK